MIGGERGDLFEAKNEDGIKISRFKKVISIRKKLKSRVSLTTLGLKFPLIRHAEQNSLE